MDFHIIIFPSGIKIFFVTEYNIKYDIVSFVLKSVLMFYVFVFLIDVKILMQTSVGNGNLRQKLIVQN